MTNHTSDNNKKIAKNTIFIYFRIFTTMFIGLYSSRIVLQVLGVSDFGIFSVVGGVLAMFTFITASLGTATSRFFNVEMGKEYGDVNKIFNENQLLHIVLAIIIFILTETIGLWYIYNKLVLPDGKLMDALFVYQVSVITICLGIINEPYSSLFSAHEKFGFLTLFDIGNTLFRFVCVLALLYLPGNSLRYYAIIMSLTTINTFIVFHIYAAHKWPNIIKFRLIKGWTNYKPLLSFSGWNLLSTVSFMARSSGSDLLLNSFFGTAVNGAYAISRSVNNYVSTFAANFDVASGPQIIQSYSSGNMERCNYLVNKLGRFSLLLFEIIFFPLYIELDFLLHLWLGNVPDGVLTFCQINLILCGISLSCGGFSQLINASGKIKWFKIEISSFFLICIPVGYVLFKLGYSQYSLLVLFIIADLLQRAVQMVLLKTILGFNSLQYMKDAYVRPILIAMIMSALLLGYSYLNITNLAMRFGSIVLCFILSTLVVYYLGLTSGERMKVNGIVKGKILQHGKH